MHIVNLGYVNSQYTGKRNYRIFETLIKQQKTFKGGSFVNPPQVLGPESSLKKRLSSALSLDTDNIAPNIKIFSPVFFLPFTFRIKMIEKIQANLILTRIKRNLPKGEGYILWINNPSYLAYSFVLKLLENASFVVFDLSDDFTVLSHDDDHEFEARFDFLLAKADVLLCVNEHVYNKFKHDNKYIFQNATSFENFQQESDDYRFPPFIPKKKGRKYVGFIGGLTWGRVDIDLLEFLLEKFKEYTFLFVGFSNDNTLLEKFSNFNNFHFFSAVPYTELPFIIKSFDVAIVPHLINDRSKGNDLLKVYDFLACGVPVVTTNCSGVEKYGASVYIANDKEQFCDFVEKIIERKIIHDSTKGLEIAQEQSWEKTVPHLEAWLEKQMINL